MASDEVSWIRHPVRGGLSSALNAATPEALASGLPCAPMVGFVKVPPMTQRWSSPEHPRPASVHVLHNVSASRRRAMRARGTRHNMDCFRKALLVTGKGGFVLVGLLAFPGLALSSAQACEPPPMLVALAGESQHRERPVTPRFFQAMSDDRTASPGNIPDDASRPQSDRERSAKAESDSRERPPQRSASDGSGSADAGQRPGTE